MIDICPTITAADARTYRVQMEQVVHYATRVHIDASDGVFTNNKLLELDHLWWPGGIRADLHIMYKNPSSHLELLIGLQPQLIIIHAEADGDFMAFAGALHSHNIEVGVALLPETMPETIKPALSVIDHVLIFSGNLGHFGGHADFTLGQKAQTLKSWKPQLEIGWDGGINDKNAKQIVDFGVEVLNAGGFFHGSTNQTEAFNLIQTAIKG